ncbi:unnamed protein product [Chondrus crispus]|uniref:Uncharacterized protein n=1 Tax=Chondrus crispus TaxID=2769 RepID=R7QDR3_CHOCR|nr:unnamed protein product [Chondrus crispus]CDF36229.1 unnamed protein product [Chondrus crispus]|eukprot:XP_005716048.1 unnamed protein product [Chondrus crispus]
MGGIAQFDIQGCILRLGATAVAELSADCATTDGAVLCIIIQGMKCVCVNESTIQTAMQNAER